MREVDCRIWWKVSSPHKSLHVMARPTATSTPRSSSRQRASSPAACHRAPTTDCGRSPSERTRVNSVPSTHWLCAGVQTTIIFVSGSPFSRPKWHYLLDVLWDWQGRDWRRGAGRTSVTGGGVHPPRRRSGRHHRASQPTPNNLTLGKQTLFRIKDSQRWPFLECV